ncbi:hypothetical protein PAENIP36_65410 [Paenibacillus sp. P36]
MIHKSRFDNFSMKAGRVSVCEYKELFYEKIQYTCPSILGIMLKKVVFGGTYSQMRSERSYEG